MTARRCLVLSALSLSLACGRHEPASTTPDATTNDTTRRAWVAKAARTLHGGTPLAPDAVRALAAFTEEDVLERLMAEPDFGDSVLGFNLYYLGYEPERLYANDAAHKDSRAYDPMVYAKPQAIAAAQAVLTGGDYGVLYTPVQPLYLAPLQSAALAATDPHRRDVGLTDDAKRKLLRDEGLAGLDQAIAAFMPGTSSKADKTAGCQAISAADSPLAAVRNGINGSGLGLAAVDLSIYPLVEVQLDCIDPAVTGEQLAGRLRALRTAYAALYAQLGDFTPDRYVVRSVADLRPARSEGGAKPTLVSSQMTYLGFWQALPNSSTNDNRKRAAYILKTYFCDDLTPVNVVAASTPAHRGDRHASDPGCQACHYKLDPMAGFFRERGIAGVDFATGSLFVFDDNSRLDQAKTRQYLDSWTEIGYVRSTRDPKANDDGKTLDDLYGILRRAPEVKACLVRRMAEYYLGRDQVFDGGWLEHLTSELSEAETQTAGFRRVVKDLLLSQTFREPDRVADQCYDVYPPGRADNGLPCAVAYVIKTNCAVCHSSRSADVGGLDLTQWDADQGFPHLDASGNPVDRKTTLSQILTRLGSTDPGLAMPKDRSMNAVDKARLYTWVSEQLGQ